MEDNKQQSYFADVPQGLANSCDTLLLLDDGTKLPVHAAILARLSGVFSGMLDGGPLAAASQNNVVVVPIEECAKDVASRFLSIVYTGESQEHITESSAWNLADLGHKLNMKVEAPLITKRMCQLLPMNAGLLSINIVVGSTWHRQCRAHSVTAGSYQDVR